MFRVFVALAIPCALIGGSGQSGAPGDSTCAACHGASTTPLASQAGGNGVFMTFSGGSTYTAGVTQSVTVTVIDNAFMSFGYQTSPRIKGQDATQGGGTLAPVDANAQFYPASGTSTLEWIAAGEGAGGAATNNFHFKWTPPASGTVVFYLIGMGGNGTGGPEPNEHVYANTYTLTPTPPAIIKPSFSPAGTLSAAANIPGLTPGGWLAIYGQNLAQTTQNWNGSDFSSGKLPTSLGGVTVTIDNKPAAVYYVNPTQIDVQVPDDRTRGPVQVLVTSAGVSSDPVIVNMTAFAPSFLTLDGKYVAATHADNT
ncbi:MAG TPA: choice-of-anchor V domain-containing protein, partial [Bryobacteraceae bacterium]|nr:choice-of-anchor V domain-containing protein [Bryobacteraceae bacterium]